MEGRSLLLAEPVHDDPVALLDAVLLAGQPDDRVCHGVFVEARAHARVGKV